MMARYSTSRLPQDRDFRSSREERVSPARYDTIRLPQDKDFRSSRAALDRERSPHYEDMFQTGAYQYGAVLYRNYAQIHIFKNCWSRFLGFGPCFSFRIQAEILGHEAKFWVLTHEKLKHHIFNHTLQYWLISERKSTVEIYLSEIFILDNDESSLSKPYNNKIIITGTYPDLRKPRVKRPVCRAPWLGRARHILFSVWRGGSCGQELSRAPLLHLQAAGTLDQGNQVSCLYVLAKHYNLTRTNLLLAYMANWILLSK